MPYIGGFPIYVQKCNEVMSNGFEGFVIDGADARNEAPRVRLTERWRVPLDIEVISPAAVAARRVPWSEALSARNQPQPRLDGLVEFGLEFVHARIVGTRRTH